MNRTIVWVMDEHLLTHSHILSEVIACCRYADLQATGPDQIASFGDLLQLPQAYSRWHSGRVTPTRA